MRLDRRARMAAAVLVCLLPGVNRAVAAQSPDAGSLPASPLPLEQAQRLPDTVIVSLSQAQIEEVEQWSRAFAEWQTWAARWLNRRQPGVWSGAVERRDKPDPPAWLRDACTLLAGDEVLARACAQLTAWDDNLISARIRHETLTAQTQKEAPTKSAWWRHAHLDAMWSTTQSSTTAFGLLGAHFTMDVEGRLQVFVAPGILLVSVPGVFGSRELMPATDWGVTYRLFNVKQTTVHFNLVHAWLISSGANLIGSQLTLAGFSFSFRPTHH